MNSARGFHPEVTFDVVTTPSGEGARELEEFYLLPVSTAFLINRFDVELRPDAYGTIKRHKVIHRAAGTRSNRRQRPTVKIFHLPQWKNLTGR